MRAWIVSLAALAAACGGSSDEDGGAAADAAGGGPADAAEGDPADAARGGPADAGSPDEDAAFPDATQDGSLPARCDPTAPFGEPMLLAELSTTSHENGAFLTEDELTIYFSREPPSDPEEEPDSDSDIYVASRASRDQPFDSVTLLPGVNTEEGEDEPAVTGDGLVLYATTDNFRGDISVARRPDTSSEFGPLSMVPELNRERGKEAWNTSAPYPMADHRAIYFEEHPDFDEHGIYRASWNGTSFDEPVFVAIEGSDDLDELTSPVVTPDELTIFFATILEGGDEDDDDRDIWFASRDSVDRPFSTPVRVAEVNTASWERPDWVSPDGCVLYLTRSAPLDSEADSELFVATRGK